MKRTFHPGFTAREREVFRLRALGLKREAVADVLYLTVHTVDFHSAHIFRKLGVHTMREAAELLKEAA